jgi:predicted DNA-binding transcriptional regulator YafY
MVYILLNKEKVTAKELSELFEVSTRTIYRDIESLSMAGVPIYTSKGKGGGIGLLDSFKVDKSLLSEEEQNKVLFGLEIMKTTKYEDVDSALLKLKTLFNKSNDNWIEVDFSYWGSSKDEKNKFEDLKYALTNNKSIILEYTNLYGNKSIRTVNPLKLVFKEKSWYLIGYCLLRKDYRVFKIYRIKNIKVTNYIFQREDYNISNLDLSFKTTNTVTLKVIISPNLKHRVYEEFNNIKQNKDGSYEVIFQSTEDEGLYNYIISFGADIKILEPVYIKDTLKNKLQKMLQSL